MKNKMKQRNVIYVQMAIVGMCALFVIKIYVLLVQISAGIIYAKILYVLIAHYFVIYVKI